MLSFLLVLFLSNLFISFKAMLIGSKSFSNSKGLFFTFRTRVLLELVFNFDVSSYSSLYIEKKIFKVFEKKLNIFEVVQTILSDFERF